MSFDLKGVFNIDGRPAARSVKEIEKEVEKSSEKMSGYLESAFSGNLGNKVFGAAFKAAGLGAIAGLVDLASKFQEKLANIKIGSIRSNLDIEAFQRVQNVTESQGSSAETAAKAMEHIAIAQEKIKKGEPEAQKLLEGFSALGVTLQDIEQRSFQDIFFKIAAGMKDAELTGERLAAVHEILGKSGAELTPAFKKGFDSANASAGMVTEQDMKNFDSMKATLAESNSIWKDMAATVGALAMAISQSFQGIPLVLKDIANGDFFRKFSPEFRKKQEEERVANQQEQALRKEQAEAIQKRDAESSKKQLEERQKQMALEKEQKKDDKKAEEEAPRLEAQLAEKQRRNQLEAMSPGARKAELKKQIEEARNDLTNATQVEEEFQGDPQAHTNRLQKAIRLQDLQHDLIGLQKPKGGNEDQVRDSLSRVGGGFASENTKVVELLDEIRDSTAKTAARLQETGSDNPMAGV